MTRGPSARPHRRPGPGPVLQRTTPAGFSLIELLFVTGIVATVSVAALPQLSHALERHRTLGAVRTVSAALQRARTLAVQRQAHVGLRFVGGGTGIQFASYADGDRDGLSTADILDGSDPLLSPARGLDGFGGAAFGLWPGLLSPDGAPFPDDDPIRLGSSDLLSFTPRGTATAGSLYIRGPGSLQYVVRVYGDTGKTHILRYERHQRRWVAP